MGTLNVPALVIAGVAAFGLFRLKWGVLRTLGVATVMGVGWFLIEMAIRGK